MPQCSDKVLNYVTNLMKEKSPKEWDLDEKCHGNLHSFCLDFLTNNNCTFKKGFIKVPVESASIDVTFCCLYLIQEWDYAYEDNNLR